MCVYKTMINNHQNQLNSLRDKLERKTKECETLKKQLAELKKEGLLQGQTTVVNTICQKPKEDTQKVEKKNEQPQEEKSASEILLRIPCAESSLFKNEIQDFLYALLYSELEKEMLNFPKNKSDEHYRKLDVLSSLLDARTFDWEKSETYKNLSKVNKALNCHKKYNYDNLPASLFYKKDNCHNHLKYCFVSERYQLTFSLTPSDGNACKQQSREIKKRCFLIPTNNTKIVCGL